MHEKTKTVEFESDRARTEVEGAISQNNEIGGLTAKSEISSVLRKPGLLWLEITPGCNLRCIQCYTESSPQISYPDKVKWGEVLSDGYKVGYRRVQFIGGEPTKHKQLPDLIDQARKLGYDSIEVYSNLTMLSRELLENFRKNRVNVATSFYSPSEEVHESITMTKGSFKKTVEGIRKVIEARLNLRVGMVLLEANKEDLKDSIAFLVSLGVRKSRIKYDYVRPVGRGSGLTSYKSVEETLCGNCWRGSLTVSWNGTVYPCVFSRHAVIGNVNEKGLEALVSSPDLKAFRESIYDSWLNKKKRILPRDCSPDDDCSPDNPCGPDDRERCGPMSW